MTNVSLSNSKLQICIANYMYVFKLLHLCNQEEHKELKEQYVAYFFLTKFKGHMYRVPQDEFCSVLVES